MKLGRSISFTIVIPALLCGVVGGIGAQWITHNWVVTLFAILPSVAATAFTAFAVQTQARRAAVSLHPSNHQSESQQSTGLFSDILKSSKECIRDLQNQQDDASHERTKLEAKFQVRRVLANQLESALKHIDVAAIITDSRGQFRLSNSAAEKLYHRVRPNTETTNTYGSAPSSKTKRTKLASFTKNQPVINLNAFPAVQSLLNDASHHNADANRRTVEFDIDKNDTITALRATVHTVTDANGTYLGNVTLFEEIGEERQEKNRYAEFISSVSHEFKTPMASMKAFTELLIDGDVETAEEQQELYIFIDEQIDRLTRMVHNMLNLTRIESGVIEVKREDCELNDVLSKAMSVVKPTADEKNIRMVSELSNLYLAANVDRDLLGQAVINLLSNAVKYTPEGGEVRLRSNMDEGKASIEVSDTGMGIPQNSLDHIFKRFYRVPENSEAASGTGLGLALVHYIVTELHNGQIAAQSEVGTGTTMTVTVPLGHRKSSRKTPGQILSRV